MVFFLRGQGVTLALCAMLLPVPGAGADGIQRIVFVGDSITDGHTYPQLVRQALAEAGRPVPVCLPQSKTTPQQGVESTRPSS